MSEQASEPVASFQSPPPEVLHDGELRFLEAWDRGPRPEGWRLTPRAVVTFLLGSAGEMLALREAAADLPSRLEIAPKFVGDRGLVERAVVTLAGERGLLLVGEPGTAKSMLSELLTAAVSRSSELTVQGTAGTTEEHLRYGWNYALLLAKGPSEEALVPSPVLVAMQRGLIVRVEEVTRCLPEVQDALVSILSDRRLHVPELGLTVHARRGFNLVATANLRDKGVSEMSSALKRRFNFERVDPIADRDLEVELVRRQAGASLARAGVKTSLDEAIVSVLVTAFRDLRTGRTSEGWQVEKPTSTMSTAEAVAVASSLGLASHFLQSGGDPLALLPENLLGVVTKDEPKDRARVLAYWDGVVKRRAESSPIWRRLHERRDRLEGPS